MSNWSDADVQSALKEVFSRASTDAAFRNKCLSDPSGAVKEVVGKDVPADFSLRFVDNANSDLTVVLPDLVGDGDELSDAELEQVAGGRCGGSCGGSCLAMST